jgi:hypothetical protein
MQDYYVYVHRHASDGKVFYIGKGKNDRAYWRHNRSRYWNNIVAKHGYTVEIVQSGMQEWWAHEMEIELIAYYGRENLCNLTDGGEGVSGLKMNEESKKRISFAHLNRSPETRARMSEGQRGRKMTDATKKRMSDSAKGRSNSEESRKKLSASRREKYGVPVNCSNGMIFPTQVSAEEWLRENGYPKATKANINSCIQGNQKSAYGHTWSKGVKNG